MTEHSTEELRRQLEAAVSKLDAAKIAKLAAERKLHERMCRDSGLMGKRAKFEHATIIVHDVEFDFSGKPRRVSGFQIKKDGSVGERERTFWSLRGVTFSDHPSTPVEATESVQ